MSTYVEVPAQQLRDYLHGLGFVLDATARGHEEVYCRAHERDPGYVVKVYSTIPRGGQQARSCGADAIRVVAVRGERGVFKATRTFRTGTVEGVLGRVGERVDLAFKACGPATQLLAPLVSEPSRAFTSQPEAKVHRTLRARGAQAFLAGSGERPPGGVDAEEPSDEPAGEPEVDALYETGLNDEQLQVVRHEAGPLLVLAQAGSGKTKTLVNRIARLIADGTDPREVLAVTFSKKAADEMNARLRGLGVRAARVGTWHSLCLEILRDGTPWANWQVDERDTAKLILKDAVGFRHLDWKTVDVGKLERVIGLCKANLVGPNDVERVCEIARPYFPVPQDQRKAADAFAVFQNLVEQRGLLTFDDMLVFAARWLEDEDNRQRWAARWTQLLQDEAQDSNEAQRAIGERLARDHRNYMVVGDPAQSIFGFRGATPEIILAFEQQWPGAKVVRMCRNYRSVSTVIAAANGILRRAETKLTGDMVGERAVDGHAVALAAQDLDAEARHFLAEVQQTVKLGGKLSDVTALFRTNAQSRALEEALLGAKVPYVVVGGTSFYERKEVKDLLGYLRVATDADPDGDAMKRCLNAPFRYLGAKTVERMLNAPRGASWAGTARVVAQQDGLNYKQRASLDEWAGLVDQLAGWCADVDQAGNPTDKAKPSATLTWLVAKTNYIAAITKDAGEESIHQSHGANVRELIRVADRFATAADLLHYIEENLKAARRQREDKQAGGERVLLMSIHRSKGLEWPSVFVCGCNDMILPHAKGDPEEERRLAYVAVTRARDRLTLSYVRELATATGVREAQPSVFLRDAGLLRDDDRANDVDLGAEAEVLALEERAG